MRLALPNNLYEAIVCGKPIIVAKGTYLEEYVKKLGVGFSVRHDSVEEIRDIITYLLQRRDSREKIRQRCFEIRDNYFYETVEQKFLGWIQKIIYG